MYHETECGCGHSAHHVPREEGHHYGGCACGHSGHRHHGHHTPRDVGHHRRECCCTLGYPARGFLTREEVIAQLEEYLKQLQLEAKGVEEKIAELKKEA